MGRRPPFSGQDAFAHPEDLGVSHTLPGAGLVEPGPSGLDAEADATTAPSLTINGWPRTISWDEFQPLAVRPPGVNEDAQIHSEVDQPSRVSVMRVHGVYRVTAVTVTLRTVSEDSWVVTAQKSDELLSHEQGHYDITGLMGRDMGREIVAARARSRDDLQTQVTSTIGKYRRRAKELSDLYDAQTDHSRNRPAQKKWDDQIRRTMQTGAAFNPP
jgi:Bacterial protein of unknown function (DUF922)